PRGRERGAAGRGAARARLAPARAGGRARGWRELDERLEKPGPRAGPAMKFWVTLEGREAEVTFHTRGEHLVVEADGRQIEADFVRLPDGEVYSLLIDGRSHVVRVSPAQEGLEVELRGMTIPVEVKHPLEKMLQAASGGRAARRSRRRCPASSSRSGSRPATR